MHKFIIWVMCIILACVGYNTAKAQTVQREGKTFIQQSKGGATASKDVSTSYVWKDTKGNSYPIILHKYTKGEKLGKWGAYVIKTSAKSGKEYKYYIPDGEKIAEVIIKEIGI